MILVLDTEANGLYNEATRMWVFCAKMLGEDEWWYYHPDVYQNRHHVRTLIAQADQLICHNGIEYDCYVLDKLNIIHKEATLPKMWDTLWMSQHIYPDRVKPAGLPGKVGPHSLEAWAIRLGIPPKVEQERWDVWDENMIRRCKRDVEITERVYYALQEEMAVSNIN